MDVHQVCESCVVCLSTQGQQKRPQPLLQCIPVGEPFGMDFKELDTVVTMVASVHYSLSRQSYKMARNVESNLPYICLYESLM